VLVACIFLLFTHASCLLLTHSIYPPFLCSQAIADPTLKKASTSCSDGNNFEPLPTYVPVPAELNRPMLAVIFLCRSMRQIKLKSRPADRIVGLSGGGNHQVAFSTFSDVLRLIGRFNLGIPYWASYSMRNTRVTHLFSKARTLQNDGKWGQAQDLLSTGEPHISVKLMM
jgi:hypothetical protein